jgi:succinyl-CoA synthetase alpha subunit
MGSEGTYEEKRRKFEEVGVRVADLPEDVPKILKEVLK